MGSKAFMPDATHISGEEDEIHEMAFQISATPSW